MIQGYNMGQINHMWNPSEFDGFMAIVRRTVRLIVTKVKETFKKAA